MFNVDNVLLAMVLNEVKDSGIKLKPVIYRGAIVPDYYVTFKGEIISTKRTTPKLLSATPGDKWNPYPKIGLVIDGKKKTVAIHRIVCETFHELPLPDILTQEEWAGISPEIRSKLLDYVSHADRYQVNHIDHDTDNYHPDNLEWVTVAENQQKYQEHVKTRA